jgi:hypothetical protein
MSEGARILACGGFPRSSLSRSNFGQNKRLSSQPDAVSAQYAANPNEINTGEGGGRTHGRPAWGGD